MTLNDSPNMAMFSRTVLHAQLQECAAASLPNWTTK